MNPSCPAVRGRSVGVHRCVRRCRPPRARRVAGAQLRPRAHPCRAMAAAGRRCGRGRRVRVVCPAVSRPGSTPRSSSARRHQAPPGAPRSGPAAGPGGVSAAAARFTAIRTRSGGAPSARRRLTSSTTAVWSASAAPARSGDRSSAAASTSRASESDRTGAYRAVSLDARGAGHAGELWGVVCMGCGRWAPERRQQRQHPPGAAGTAERAHGWWQRAQLHSSTAWAHATVAGPSATHDREPAGSKLRSLPVASLRRCPSRNGDR